jgi:ubiquinone/menaquinone biosynthesis C-methylase UbiE
MKDTSWKEESGWYDALVGEKGHFYHREVIIPGTLRLLSLRKGDSVLDIGCGQGVFSRCLPEGVHYLGMDTAQPMLNKARSYKTKALFLKADVTKPWPELDQHGFSHAVCMLALQNMSKPEVVFSELAKVIRPNGLFVVILNHPCFRIPRQSRWGFDEKTKTQTRELFSYMSPQKIPILMHPGTHSGATDSFHLPISAYASFGAQHGFSIDALEEWCSPKVSVGGAARWENRARKEFPLFLAICYRKK